MEACYVWALYAVSYSKQPSAKFPVIHPGMKRRSFLGGERALQLDSGEQICYYENKCSSWSNERG
jgi:hypothetical protein